MRHIKKWMALLLCSMMSLCALLSGCNDLSESTDSETSTAVLQYNGDAEMNTDDFITETIESTEETGTTEEIIYSTWGDYEITTNEVGYDPDDDWLDEKGYYTSEEDVALYIIEYHTLPDNFMTKKEAKSLGWTGGGLDYYEEDACIGGDYFGNHEGLLPKVKGRTYYECDIDTMNAKKRGAKRIIYSDDGQIYYTDDHYESFTLIYGTDE